MTVRVLIVEDDPATAEVLTLILTREGFDTRTVGEGLHALAELDRSGADMVLLDVVLPGMSGLQVLRQIRTDSLVPVIVVSARDTELDKVLALELGADDYLSKPYSARELIARIRAVLRRDTAGGPLLGSVLVAGHLQMDVPRHLFTVDGVATTLPLKEFALMQALLQSPDRLLTRERLIERLWGDDDPSASRPLDIYVKRLRTRIEAGPTGRPCLLTVLGVGYILQT